MSETITNGEATEFFNKLWQKMTPEQIEAAKIESEKLKKDAEQEKLIDRCWESYDYFFEKNKHLPYNANAASIESLKSENEEIYSMLSNWGVYSDFGFCICGPVGTGKTYALTAILNHVASTLASDGYAVNGSIYWNTASMLLEQLKDSYNADESVLKKIEKIQKYNYLFIDDFGAHKFSDYAVEKLISILDYRVNNNLPTFFSTNCKLEQMRQTFGERVFSRIIACSVMVEVKGKDRRLDIHAERIKQLKGAK